MIIKTKVTTFYLRIFLYALSAILLSGNGGRTAETVSNASADSIILFIGDGMGWEHRKAARWITSGPKGSLAMDDMPAKGWSRTSAADGSITDSAAAATAMATGAKTYNRVIGLKTDFSLVPTILEDAKRLGKSVGLVTTTQITHATPAAFAAHVKDRGMMTDIARQLLTAGVDVLLGGGEDEFLPAAVSGCHPHKGARSDGRNLIEEAIAAGYTYVCDPSAFNSAEPSAVKRLLGLFADGGMQRPFSPALPAMTRKALDILSKNSRGFFLMVESGQIDWASHDNDAANAISDTVELDQAVRVAKTYAAAADNTLIIVTADHETGGMQISLAASGSSKEDGPFPLPDGRYFYVNWSTRDHTGVDVPLTAQGPASGRLNGVYENTFVYEVMAGVLNHLKK
jgi:alkaline phosphatase